MSMSTRPPPPPPHQPPPSSPSPSFDLEVTIISGKHLKNVNWKNGDLKPYAIFWVDPDNKLTTKSDDSGKTKPVWNQRFLIPITVPFQNSSFTLEIFHSRASETPKPFVGSFRVGLSDLPDPNNQTLIRTFDLLRPSGRPQGKIRLKLAIQEHPLPPNPYYFSSAPPYPYGSVSRSSAGPAPAPATAYPYTMGYYTGYYPPPVTQSRTYPERYGAVAGAPSAPMEYGQSRGSSSGFGIGTGLAVGAVAGALGGMALEEGLRHEEAKIGERVEENLCGRDDFSDYRGDY